MKLIHYTNEEFKLGPEAYPEPTLCLKIKPNGLWVSVEGENDWKSWCEANEFQLDHLFVCYEVKLKENANVLHLQRPEEIVNFGKQYPYIKPQWDNPEGRKICRTYDLDWTKVKQVYQGIIITPFQWSCHINQECSWYYGWDCASGCIWDLDCIEEFKLMENTEKNYGLATNTEN